MLTYFVEYPRDFANEYTVYAVKPGLVKRFREICPDARRVSRAEAIRLGWTRVREAKRYGEQWFGGFAEDTCSNYPETLTDQIREAAETTERMIETADAAKAEYASL